MSRQIYLFLTAVQFLTRAPVPSFKAFDPDWIRQSARYFPLVGGMVGLISAAVFIAASTVWTGALPALLATGAGILMTGAFHEDGLADTADGLGGGQTPERRLEIMKDSRLGTYGVLALVLALSLKVAALSLISPALVLAALLAAHAGGRGVAVLAMRLSPYAGDRASTKVKPVADGVGPTEIIVALIFTALAIVPAALFSPVIAAVSVGVGGLCAGIVALQARRLIGGWVGDTLGACEQAFEIGFLVAFAGMVVA